MNYPNTAQLSETYLRLEGFTEVPIMPETTPVTLADVVDEEAQLPAQSWQDTFITFGVIFTLLVTSSLTLGFGANRISLGLRYVTHQLNQQQAVGLGTPTSWRF